MGYNRDIYEHIPRNMHFRFVFPTPHPIILKKNKNLKTAIKVLFKFVFWLIHHISSLTVLVYTCHRNVILPIKSTIN